MLIDFLVIFAENLLWSSQIKKALWTEKNVVYRPTDDHLHRTYLFEKWNVAIILTRRPDIPATQPHSKVRWTSKIDKYLGWIETKVYQTKDIDRKTSTFLWRLLTWSAGWAGLACVWFRERDRIQHDNVVVVVGVAGDNNISFRLLYEESEWEPTEPEQSQASDVVVYYVHNIVTNIFYQARITHRHTLWMYFISNLCRVAKCMIFLYGNVYRIFIIESSWCFNIEILELFRVILLQYY